MYGFGDLGNQNHNLTENKRYFGNDFLSRLLYTSLDSHRYKEQHAMHFVLY